jgi:hypothetical protein
MSVQTVTSLARAAAAEASATEINTAEAAGQGWNRRDVVVEVMERGGRQRASGRRFGTLVHALLAPIDLDAGVDAAIKGRLVGATEEEVRLPLPRPAGRSRLQYRGEPQPAPAKADTAARLLFSLDWMTAASSRAQLTSPLARIRLITLVGPSWISRRTASSRRRSTDHCAGEGLFRSGKRGLAGARHHSCVLMTSKGAFDRKGAPLGKMPASPTIWNLDILSPREHGLVYRRQLDRPEVTRRPWRSFKVTFVGTPAT